MAANDDFKTDCSDCKVIYELDSSNCVLFYFPTELSCSYLDMTCPECGNRRLLFLNRAWLATYLKSGRLPILQSEVVPPEIRLGHNRLVLAQFHWELENLSADEAFAELENEDEVHYDGED